MLLNQKVVVIMPAYNAASTLEMTFKRLPLQDIDEIILVDDASKDDTAEIARKLGIKTIVHKKNLGYGGNQKTCYQEALKSEADIIVMIHPDYQYPPELVIPMAAMIASGYYDVVLGSRILGGGALKGDMPLYKYVANRLLTFIQNLVFGVKLSEYHTGLRAFRRNILERLPLNENSDDFIFDNEMLVQAIYFGYRIGEISCPTRYFKEASSISFSKSIKYGIGVIWTTIRYILTRYGIKRFPFLQEKGKTNIDSL